MCVACLSAFRRALALVVSLSLFSLSLPFSIFLGLCLKRYNSFYFFLNLNTSPPTT